jgi:hypothetical protein
MTALLLPESYLDRPRMESTIVDKMHNGDATMGWSGDPQLALYSEPDGSYILARLGTDGRMRKIARNPGGRLDDSLIAWLVAHDTWHVDPLESVS